MNPPPPTITWNAYDVPPPPGVWISVFQADDLIAQLAFASGIAELDDWRRALLSPIKGRAARQVGAYSNKFWDGSTDRLFRLLWGENSALMDLLLADQLTKPDRGDSWVAKADFTTFIDKRGVLSPMY